MIARAFWTICVVAAFCAAGAGADAARVARVHVVGPPALNVGTSCEAAGSGSVVAGRNKESCLADETTALNTLKQNWSKYQVSDKAECVNLENNGGPASYVELLSCLEVRRDARTIKNADPLESDLDSSGKRRGRQRFEQADRPSILRQVVDPVQRTFVRRRMQRSGTPCAFCLLAARLPKGAVPPGFRSPRADDMRRHGG